MTSIGSSLLPSVATETLNGFEVETVSIPTANTVVSHTLPTATLTFALQNRDDGVVLFRHSTNGPYWTLFPGQPYYINNIKSSASITIYLESPKASQTIEVLSWA